MGSSCWIQRNSLPRISPPLPQSTRPRTSTETITHAPVVNDDATRRMIATIDAPPPNMIDVNGTHANATETTAVTEIVSVAVIDDETTEIAPVKDPIVIIGIVAAPAREVEIVTVTTIVVRVVEVVRLVLAENENTVETESETESAVAVPIGNVAGNAVAKAHRWIRTCCR